MIGENESQERNCDDCIHGGKCDSFPYCDSNYISNDITTICPECKKKTLEITGSDLVEGVEWFYCQVCEITGRFYYTVKFDHWEIDKIKESEIRHE